MTFDIKTIMLFNILVNLIATGALMIVWKQNHKLYKGITFWLVDMFFQAIGSFLIILRGQVPDFISIVLANAFILSGMIFLLAGMERFVGKKTLQIHNLLLIAASVGLLSFYSLIQPILFIREIIISAMIVIMNMQICWLLFQRASIYLRRITFITGSVLGGYVFVSLVRIVLLATVPLNTGDFLKSGLVDSLPIILYITLTSCLTISIILMVNKRLLSDVQAAQEKFTTSFKASPYAITLTRPSDGVIFEVNEGFVNITGYQYDEAIGKTTIDLNLWKEEDDRLHVVKELEMGKKVEAVEFKFQNKSGGTIEGLFSASIIVINNEKCILSSISDITELSLIKQKLQQIATHDSLTGLPNRSLLYDKFDTATSEDKQNQNKAAIATLDLDWFKNINDTYGHDNGDKVLIAAANRLTEVLGENDTISRFGGDEFVLLMEGISCKEDAAAFTQKVLDRFRQPFEIDGHELYITVSIGIALYPDDGSNINDLIKKSDYSLYHVKANGRNNCHFYDEMINYG